MGVVNDMDDTKLFILRVTHEIRCHWLNELNREVGPEPASKYLPNEDSGLQSLVNNFLNQFCLLNGSGPGFSRDEFLEHLILKSRLRVKDDIGRFYLGFWSATIVERSFQRSLGPTEKKYISTLKIPDTCKHSSWRDFSGIYDEDGYLKPEYRTREEVEEDKKYSAAGVQPGKRKKREARDGASSHRLQATDVSINPVETTVEEVFGSPKGSMSKEARRQLWWDNLIGPDTGRKICRF